MELSAFLGKRVIIYAPLKYGHCVFLCHFHSTGFNMYTICLKMSSETLWSNVFNNSHSDESGLF